MRALARISIVTVLVAGLGSLAVSATATTSKLPELPVSELLTPAGKLTTLHSGVTYQASQFPFPLRVTPPDGAGRGRSGSRTRTVTAAGPRSTAGPPSVRAPPRASHAA
jgi:hypothetical protein